MAQASCVALAPQEGWIFAIRRDCGRIVNCQYICSDPNSTEYKHVMSLLQGTKLEVYVKFVVA